MGQADPNLTETLGTDVKVDGHLSFFSYLIWLVKLTPKFLHQAFAIMLHWKLIQSIQFKLVTEAWRLGNNLGESPGVRFVGFRIALLSVPIHRIRVTNDLPNPNQVVFREQFIQIEKSSRFNRVMGRPLSAIAPPLPDLEDSHSQLTQGEQKILFLSKNQVRYSCYVVLKLSGDVLVVDGTHRLFATILRDRSIDNINIYVAI